MSQLLRGHRCTRILYCIGDSSDQADGCAPLSSESSVFKHSPLNGHREIEACVEVLEDTSRRK